MTIRMVQPLTVLPGVNEQTAANQVTIAAAGTSQSREYRELAGFQQGTFILDVSAASGTSPTLDVTVQGQDPVSLKWHTLVTFAQQNATTSTVIAPQTIELYHCNYRANFVVAGTTPSFTFSLACIMRTGEPIV